MLCHVIVGSGTMARVQPDRRWFGNTRVIGQRQLEQFREAMAEKVNDPYQMLMRQSKLPMSLLEDNVKVLSTQSTLAVLCWPLPGLADVYGYQRGWLT